MYVYLSLQRTLRAAGLVALSLGHKGHLSVVLPWGRAGDVVEQLLDARVPNRAPERSRRKHVQHGVDRAADEDQGSGHEDHGVPGTFQALGRTRVGLLDGQLHQCQEVAHVMRRPAHGEHHHHTAD